ncbi:MAG: tRNA preQ1(34) S-adenosylmethionine ribosyltransferase-isomerase QueA [Candidatus Latescibacterota bacterium]
MKLRDLDFALPEAQIAQFPVPVRDGSRLLVLERATGTTAHRVFRDLVDYLRPPDVLVVNETRVRPARLRGRKAGTGGAVELLLLRQDGDEWVALGRPGRRLQPGTRLEFGHGALAAQVTSRPAPDRVRVRFAASDLEARLEALGEVPLPPYIRRPPQEEDRVRYQTVYARQGGAVAAPTAGLHFTPELLGQVQARGVRVAPVVLHVGPGTFEPVRVEDVAEHRLEAEYFEVPEATAAEVQQGRTRGGRIVAVGTTVVRALESAVAQDGGVRAACGWTDKYIYPPYQFRAVDALVTNFHLPRSSLLLLVAAFAGCRQVLRAYAQAVEAGYRFYSFGDAMLIV